MIRLQVNDEMLSKAIKRANEIYANTNNGAKGGNKDEVLRGVLAEEAVNILYPRRISLSQDNEWFVDAKLVDRYKLEIKSFQVQKRYIENDVITIEGLERLNNYSLLVNKRCSHNGIEEGPECRYCNPTFDHLIVCGVSQNGRYVYLWGFLSKDKYLRIRKRAKAGEIVSNIKLRRENWHVLHKELDPIEGFLPDVIKQGLSRIKDSLKQQRDDMESTSDSLKQDRPSSRHAGTFLANTI